MKRYVIIVILASIFLIVGLSVAQKGMQSTSKKPTDLPDTVYGTSHALLIGINKYPNLTVEEQLHYAVADAESLADVLQNKFGFSQDNITILKNQQATKQGILDALNSLSNPDLVKDNDCVVIFYSGHGQTVQLPKNRGGEMGFLVPYDAKISLSGDPNPFEYDRYGIGMDELNRKAKLIPAKHVIFLVDACYSGLCLESSKAISTKVPGYLKRVATSPVIQMITAGGKGEESTENSDLVHGLFTSKLLDGMNNMTADENDDGVITGRELSNYLYSRVMESSKSEQTPQFGITGEGDFIFLPQTPGPITPPPKRPEIPPLRNEKPKEIIGKDGAKMVLIPAGDFEMGTNESEISGLVQWAKKWYSAPQASRFENETPRHTVYTDAFYMDVYEVTNAQYKSFMDATGHKSPYYWSDSNYNAPNKPVVGVSWDDAKAYAEWAGERLPTEAEWEKSARGGLVGKKFPWGDADPNGTQCNFADKNTSYAWADKSVDDGYQYTAPVGKYTSNGYGLYDMAGNVWKWCADWYDKGYYSSSDRRDPKGPSSGSSRVLRGGSWYLNPCSIRVSYRRFLVPTLAYDVVGFRCVGLR